MECLVFGLGLGLGSGLGLGFVGLKLVGFGERALGREKRACCEIMGFGVWGV